MLPFMPFRVYRVYIDVCEWLHAERNLLNRGFLWTVTFCLYMGSDQANRLNLYYNYPPNRNFSALEAPFEGQKQYCKVRLAPLSVYLDSAWKISCPCNLCPGFTFVSSINILLPTAILSVQQNSLVLPILSKAFQHTWSIKLIKTYPLQPFVRLLALHPSF